jgi:hypothetical protein
MALNVALVGSAPSSITLAPIGLPGWEIWACSPGAWAHLHQKPIDAWFELHLWEPGQPWFSPEYVAWLTAFPQGGKKLWVGSSQCPVPNASVLPTDEILAEFDPERWFCTSSLFWMMAMAIRAGATKIGFWGVDMAATEEYEMQRAGIHYLSYIARARGIEVGAPLESDLFRPRFRYGIDEWTHSYRKTRARQADLAGRRAMAQQRANEAQQEATFLTGALDDLNYMAQTWADKALHAGPAPLVVEAPFSPLLKGCEE